MIRFGSAAVASVWLVVSSTTLLRGRSSSLLECGPVTQMKAANAWTVFLRGREAVMCCLPVELLHHAPSTVTRIYLESMKFRDRLAFLLQPNVDPTGRSATGQRALRSPCSDTFRVFVAPLSSSQAVTWVK
jgi:hypothetical protein